MTIFIGYQICHYCFCLLIVVWVKFEDSAFQTELRHFCIYFSNRHLCRLIEKLGHAMNGTMFVNRKMMQTTITQITRRRNEFFKTILPDRKAY